MEWTAHHVALRLRAPLHSGWRTLGNVQQTRPYLTGRQMWGALTATLTRRTERADYQDMGRKVDEQLAFTYFYPSTDRERVTHWPWEARDLFSWLYLGSYSSTALAGDGALAGSLHETEFIAPDTRPLTPNGTAKPVFLVGYIFATKECDLRWQDALVTLRVGGEQGYGWGRLERIVCKPIEACPGDGAPDATSVDQAPKSVRLTALSAKRDDKSDAKSDDPPIYSVDLSGDRPVVCVPKDAALLAHTVATVTGETRDGQIEPFLGRETSPRGQFGAHITKPTICWRPGGKVTKEQTYQIEHRGLWTAHLDSRS